MGTFGFSITIKSSGLRRDSSAVDVERALDELGLPGLVLKSSRRKAPHIGAGGWPDFVPEMIRSRLGGEGPQKGRALAIWQGDVPVAVCSWHLPHAGPLVIFDLGCHNSTKREQAADMADVLMLCLRDIAGAFKRDTKALRWGDHPIDRLPKADQAAARAAVRGRAAALGFTALRPRPKWWKGRWATELRF